MTKIRTSSSTNRVRPLLAILGAFIVLSALYGWATPIFEASDELWHFGMVDYIAENGALPVQEIGVETAYRQEGSQPPLYYVLSALLVRGIDRGDFEALAERNPHALTGIPGAASNKNMLLHDSLNPAPTGTALAVYVLRGFSVLLGLVTVTAVYLIGLRLGGRTYAALAAGLTAFNPMFVFISASVNNDNLVTALNSLVILQLVVVLWQGLSWRRSLGIAVLVALASLSKLSGLVLVPVIVAVAAYLGWRDKDWRGFVTLGVMMAVAWGAIAGWWYLRNLQLYGELFGTSTMVAVAGPRLEAFTPITLINEFEGFRVSYWGLFGGVNVLAWAPFYWLTDALTVLALTGLALAVYEVYPYIYRSLSRYRRLYSVQDLLNSYWLLCALLFAVIFMLALGSLIAWTAQTYASQGRLLFPFIAAISPLLATGLLHWMRRQRARYASIFLGVFGGVALLMPFLAIRPAYAPPRPLAELPPSATPVYARYGDVELIGYEVDDELYRAGERLPITVYWRALSQTERDLSAYLTVINPAGEAIGKVDTYPGGGTLRTTTWTPGTIIPDRYELPLDGAGDFDLRLQVGWWHFPSGEVLMPTDADSAPLESVLLDVGGYSGGRTLRVGEPVNGRVVYDGRIRLRAYEIVDGRNVVFTWQALRGVEADYTIFVQLFNEAGEIVAQGDRPPPLATGYWERGETVVSRHDLTYDQPLTAGRYTMIVGWYDAATGERLTLRGGEDAYTLVPIRVTPRSPTE